MTDQLDPELQRHFAQAASQPLDQAFVATLLEHMERASRARVLRHAACLVLLALLLLSQLPALLRTSAGAASRLVVALAPASSVPDALSTWVISPSGWAVSLLIGAAVLRRSLPRRAAGLQRL